MLRTAACNIKFASKLGTMLLFSGYPLLFFTMGYVWNLRHTVNGSRSLKLNPARSIWLSERGRNA